MAAPHVAGAVALLRDLGVGDALAVKALLINSTGQTSGWSAGGGWGQIDLERAVAERHNIIRSEIAPASTRIWRIRSNSSFQASLVWNKSIYSEQDIYTPPNDLNLELFDTNDFPVSSSREPAQNVEQVRSFNGRTGLLRLTAGKWHSTAEVPEPFALVYSAGAEVEELPLPLNFLSLSCAAPATAASGATIDLTCQLQNRSSEFSIGGNTITGSAFGEPLPSRSLSRLAPGATQTITWRLTVPRNLTGTQSVSVRAASTAYGGLQPAAVSSSVRIVAAAPLPTLNVSPASLEVSMQQGAAARTLTLTAQSSSPAGSFRASASEPWILVTQSGPTVSVRVDPSRLSSGTHRGQVLFQSSDYANTPFSVPVTLNVQSAPAGPFSADIYPSLTGVTGNGPCQNPDPVFTFLPSVIQIHAWTNVYNVTPADDLRIEFSHPSTGLYRTERLPQVRATGNYCMSASMNVAGTSIVTANGAWTMRLTRNGELAGVNFFVISPHRVGRVITSAVTPVSNGCVAPVAATRFTPFTREIYVWFELNSLFGGEAVDLVWWNPNGTRFKTETTARVPDGGDWCIWRTLAVAGTPAAAQTGFWWVEGSVNGRVAFSRWFEIR